MMRHIVQIVLLTGILVVVMVPVTLAQKATSGLTQSAWSPRSPLLIAEWTW
jgi:hypothetical protein